MSLVPAYGRGGMRFMVTTATSWRLGRSRYASDPRFNGRMQYLRTYSGALSAAEIAALRAG